MKDLTKFIRVLAALLLMVSAFSCDILSNKDDQSDVQNEIPLADSDRLQEHLDYLASDALRGRRTGTEGIAEAAEYIQKELEAYGWQPYKGSYRHSFMLDSVQGENVVALLPGTDEELKNEYVILGAHYDHIGIINAIQGDSIANGANDNASGTATVMELTRLFKDLSPKRTIMVALFSAEEMGLVGSRKLASDMKNNGVQLSAMVNFEMTGVPMTSGKRSYITGYDKSNMADLFNQHMVTDTITGFFPQAQQFGLFRRSDNYPFFQEFNVPAQTISTFDFTNYNFYHQPGDEPQLMDTEHMASLINEVVPGLLEIINGNELKLNSSDEN